MSTTPPTEPTAPAPGEPRRLTRSKDDRVLAGVCGGLARYFAIDPVIVRIVALVLVFFGGAGPLLYIAAILLVPNDGAEGAPPGALITGSQRNRGIAILGVLLLVIAVGPLVVAPVVIVGGILFPLAFLVIAALVATWLATGRWPDREAGPIARAVALGLGLLTTLLVAAAAAFWGSATGGEEIVAGLVIAAGAALVAGAFVRPMRWLIPLALALAIPAGFVAAADVDLDGGVGDKRYRPGSVAEVRDRYQLGIGELTVDLRGVALEPGRDQHVDLDVGIGHALLLVDEGVCVAAQAQAGVGQVEVFDFGSGGIDVDVDQAPRARTGRARIVVTGDVGVGLLEVAHREPSQLGPQDFRPHPPGDPLQGPNGGCVDA